MATRFVEVPVSRSSIVIHARYVAQFDSGYITGSFYDTNLAMFHDDGNVGFPFNEIKKLWKIDDSEFPKSINLSDAITSGIFKFSLPQWGKTPLKYYVVKNPTHNAFLSLYVAIPIKVLQAVQAGGITFEGYRVHPEWGMPLDQIYRYDLVVTVPVRAESPIYDVNVSNACSKLIFYTSTCFSKINGYLQLLNNAKSNFSLDDDNLMVGTILDGRGYFSVTSHRLSPQCGRSIALYLPVDRDGSLSKDIRNSNVKILGQPLDEKWGDPEQFQYNGFTSPDMRVVKAAYYHNAECIDDKVLKFIRRLEKKIYEHCVEPTVIIKIDGANFHGTFLDCRCHFEARPIQIKSGIVDHYGIHQGGGVSCNSQKTWALDLYLPVDTNEYLIRDLQQHDALFGEELRKTWGIVVPSHYGTICRKGSAVFYHDPQTVKNGLVNFLYNIERQLRKCQFHESAGGYRSIIHLENL